MLFNVPAPPSMEGHSNELLCSGKRLLRVGSTDIMYINAQATPQTPGLAVAGCPAPVEQQTVIHNGLESSAWSGMFASGRATHGGAVNLGAMVRTTGLPHAVPCFTVCV